MENVSDIHFSKCDCPVKSRRTRTSRITVESRRTSTSRITAKSRRTTMLRIAVESRRTSTSRITAKSRRTMMLRIAVEPRRTSTRQGSPSSPEGQVHVKDRRRVQKDKDIEDHHRVQKDKYVKDYRRFQKDKYMSRIAFESRRTSTCQGLPSSPEGQVHVKDRRRILDDMNVKMIWLKMVDPC